MVDVIIDGSNYSGITSIQIPKQAGGNTEFINLPGPEPKQINFIDYDGTLLYSYTAAEFAELTALPNNPSHIGLVSQGWNWTQAQINAQLTAAPGGEVWVGQMYVTASGKSEIDVYMPPGRLSPTLSFFPNGTVIVDWGDGSTPDSVHGTGSRYSVPHTYASAGYYTITVEAANEYSSYSFSQVSDSYTILRRSTSLNSNYVYANCVQNVRLGSGITNIGLHAFDNCNSLKSITIPNTVTSVPDYALANCSLLSVTLPSSVTVVYDNCFYSSASLRRVSLPGALITMGSSLFSGCKALKDVTIPSGVTVIPGYAFQACRALPKIVIPNAVTKLEYYSFYNCYSLSYVQASSALATMEHHIFYGGYGIGEYHFLSTTPPTISSTDIFQNMATDCIIYVPYSADHSVLNAYKTANTWSNWASRMQEEPAS